MKIVFDIDGTLADITHRLHHITGKKKNWDAFFSMCSYDLPILPMVEIYKSLEPKNLVFIVTGRREKERIETENWLAQHGIKYYSLSMRKNNDYRPDYVVKGEIVQELIDSFGTIDLAVDDSPKVIETYKNIGIFTIDVNQGEDK